MIPFEELREFFADELEYGQLCDIVAPDAKREHWGLFLDRVVRRHAHTFCVATRESESVQPLPSDAARVLDWCGSEEGPWPGLGLDVDGTAVRVHMYDPDWLELDVWRREVNERAYRALAALMREMGEAMRRDIFMTPESRPGHGHVVYAVEERRFRRPRHGDGSDGALWRRFAERARAAVAPLARLTPESAVRAFRDDPSGMIARVSSVLQEIEQTDASASELRKQDELSSEQRGSFNSLWTGMAMLIRPPAGQRPHVWKAFYWRMALDAARRFT